MAATLPAPNVPDLGADNAIDIEKLGADDLETWVTYPGIAEGDEFWLAWWGCTALGQSEDDFLTFVHIGPGELQPEGVLVPISNDKLINLDQGWVFYSYRMNVPGTPDAPGEESQRRFFYVGKRPSPSLLLPVPQLRESHDLNVVLRGIGDGGATLVVAPYQAMSVDDKVTFTLDRYFEENDPWDPHTFTKTLQEADIGKPLEWKISKNELSIIDGGFMHMSYRIVYATPTVPSDSAIQTVYVIQEPPKPPEPVEPLLPVPAIEDFTGGELDPDVFPNGITLTIPMYAGIQIGDEVVVYASGDTSVVKTFRVDPSTIDSTVLEVQLDYPWLAANNGKDVSLMYQYARVGSAGTSEQLPLALRKPLNLPRPIVQGATPDSDDDDNDKGFLLAESITGGVYIKVPEEAVIGLDDKVQMHWQGYGDSGKYIADPTAGDAKRFYIPPLAVPANMGKRLNVFYKVTPPGKDSKVFDLEIKDMTTGWPTLQIDAPASPNNRVSLAAATSGVVFKLYNWPYMAAGQRLKIVVEGLLSAGGKEDYELRTGDAEVVTDDEYNAGELKATLPRDFLLKLELYQQFNVAIAASFDGGDTYKSFPSIAPQLVV